MENKNAKNAYVCDLLHGTVTINRDNGTTPMFIECPQCRERATSRMGKVSETLIPTHEWYKPDEHEKKAEITRIMQQNRDANKDMISKVVSDHVSRGGLLIRKINS